MASTSSTGPATIGMAITIPPTRSPHRRATSVAATTSAGASVILSARLNTRRRYPRPAVAPSGVVGRRVVGAVVAAGAADDDLVLFDDDLDRTVAGPELGVHRVVLDGGVQPQAVPLLAVVEGALERRAGLALAGPAGAATGRRL